MLINMNFFSEGALDLNKLRSVLIRMEVCASFVFRELYHALTSVSTPRHGDPPGHHHLRYVLVATEATSVVKNDAYVLNISYFLSTDREGPVQIQQTRVHTWPL
jgi:hypothetical protein